MNKCEIVDAKDGECESRDSHVTFMLRLLLVPNGIKNGWKINNADKDDKWYILFAKTAQMKQEWMKAFVKEREQVKDDEINGKKICCIDNYTYEHRISNNSKNEKSSYSFV